METEATTIESAEASSISPVAFEEMAFAVALFVGAARGYVPLPARDSMPSKDFEQKIHVYLADDNQLSREVDERPDDELPLAYATSVLWSHYSDDARQQAICSRLVAFYWLMIRSRGVVIEQWLGPAGVQSAVIRAVSQAPLNERLQFDDLAFLKWVDKFARDRNSSHPASTRQMEKQALFSVTVVVQELAKLLFACQATIACIPDHDSSARFHVLERLCEIFQKVCGAHGMQPLLSRALTATQVEFPWLGPVQIDAAGYLQVADQLRRTINLENWTSCELALVAALVELLRSILGDAVTLRLLRTAWPLAAFHYDGLRKVA